MRIYSSNKEFTVLDAYIIEKIRRDQERTRSERIPLHIEIPRPRRDERRWQRDDEERDSDRGVVIVDL